MRGSTGAPWSAEDIEAVITSGATYPVGAQPTFPDQGPLWKRGHVPHNARRPPNGKPTPSGKYAGVEALVSPGSRQQRYEDCD